MDFWARLIGSTPKKPAARLVANDPSARLARFRRVYNTVLELCNRPRNLSAEDRLLQSLHNALERIVILLREESRAPVPHTCLQFAGGNRIYAIVARAAIVSQYEPVIRSAVALFSALVDSDEEDFLASGHFAKSLMRLVRRVLESGDLLVDNETETSMLELLFTISAKIRLQPEILPVWFQSTAKPELEDVFVKEKKSFAGITQKDDFPLCYLMIDRVHHEGRIGDFARTGLLYIFEATGRSVELEEWVISSDLSTLMASGLGALYSQLSRELSILHPDATLPPVLALSDYTTTHSRATAESAFSERHKAHMSTFLSYLAFWQDVLDHCRSAEVKQTLLDHFQLLFLQQLLYPSLLQSSDTDAGSSIAVLTYMCTMLEALEYPDLVHMILVYLLAIQDQGQHVNIPSALETPVNPSAPSPSPTSVRRRQSLILLSAPKNPDDAVDPNLFNLVDLIINNITSRNSQSVYAALRLSATMLTRQKKYAFGALLKVQKTDSAKVDRMVGALQKEVGQYFELAVSLHPQPGLDDAYQSLCDDFRFILEAQVSPRPQQPADGHEASTCTYLLDDDAHFMRTLRALLRTFLTNSVEVNLALTQVLVSIAQCIELRLDAWLALSSSAYRFADDTFGPAKHWRSFLDSDEQSAWATLETASRQPIWSLQEAPTLYRELKAIASELDTVRNTVPNLDQLIASRKTLLQAASIDDAMPGEPSSSLNSPTGGRSAYLDVPQAKKGHSRSSSGSSLSRGRSENKKATNTISTPHSSASASRATSRPPTSSQTRQQTPQRPPGREPVNSNGMPSSLFLPPPPETPSTTDVLMRQIELPEIANGVQAIREGGHIGSRTASLNHILTNVVVLQEFVLELVAVLQVRAAVLGEKEVRLV